MRRSFRSTLGLAALSAGLFACGSAPPPSPRPPKRAELHATGGAPKGSSAPPMLPAHVVAQLDAEDATGFFARRGDSALLMVSAKGRWQVRPLAADGAPTSAEPIDIGPAPQGIAVASLRAAGDGYIATWIEPVEKNSAIKIVTLDATGHPKGGPVLVAQVAADVSFVDVLPNATGALMIWEIAHDDRYDVYAAPVAGGKPQRSPSVVARDALGWEAVGTSRGAAVVTVIDARGKAAGDASGDEKRGRVMLTEIDTSGVAAAPSAVSDEPTGHVDVGIVEVGNRYVVSWTDARDIDALVYLAAVERGGKVAVAPHRAMAPVGEQAMVALVAPRSAAGAPGAVGPAPGARALLAWEDLLRAPGGDRQIHLATVGEDATLGPDRGTLVFSANGPPDLSTDGDGFAAVTLAPSSVPGAEAPPGPAPVWPVYVRFGPDLSVLASEPVRADAFVATGGGVPYLTRGLTCEAGTCTVLASAAGSPAALAVVSLPVRPSSWHAPAFRDPADAPPRMTSLQSIYDGDHLSRVAATALDAPDAGSLVAWVTYYLDGAAGDGTKPKPGEEGFAATLGVRAVSAKGELGKINVLSRRAHSVGGVALAPAPGGAGAMLAWVAREKGKPQVYVTRLDAQGAKTAQKALTSVARKDKDGVTNEAADVAIAYAGTADTASGKGEEQWIIAWSDTRDDNSEIYVSKVDKTLRKIVPDRRITQAPGDSVEVQIAVRGDDTFLVWSDARDRPDDGSADIYSAHLETRSLKKIGDDTRLFASAGHSRTPSLTATASGLDVAWIEEPPAESGASTGGEGGVRIAYLDGKGGLIGAPLLLGAPDRGPATSVALRCGTAAASKCRGVLTYGAGEGLAVGAFDLSAGPGPVLVKTIGGLSGGITQDPSPALVGPGSESVFFADDALGGAGRVRWMSLAW